MFVSAYVLSFSTALASFFVKAKFAVLLNVLLFVFIVPFLLCMPRLLYRHSSAKKRVTKEWITYFDRISFLMLGVEIPAVLFFHESGFLQFDRFIHFVSAFAVSIGALLFFFAFKNIVDARTISFASLLTIFFIVFISLFLWEGYQYSMDAVFKTNIFFGDIVQNSSVDFWEDIFFGLLGTSSGIFFIDRRSRAFLALRKVSS